jgi:secondary thiamine-phosphate synthase enzyme
MKKETLTLRTQARSDFLPVSQIVQSALDNMGARDGVCTLYVPHTTAGVFINEGYDPDVMRDVEAALEKTVPWRGGYAHGEGNAAAHIKAILVGNSQQVLVENGQLLLGRWEEIFFAEFDGPRSRNLIVSFID